MSIKVELPCSYKADNSGGRVIAEITGIDRGNYIEINLLVNGVTYKFDGDVLARALKAVP